MDECLCERKGWGVKVKVSIRGDGGVGIRPSGAHHARPHRQGHARLPQARTKPASCKLNLVVCERVSEKVQVHEAESDVTRTLHNNSQLPAKSQKGEREKGERERERERGLTWVIQQSVVEIRRACYRIDHLLMWRGVNQVRARLWSVGTPPCRQLAPVMSVSRGLASSDAAAASRITDYAPFMSALANRREPSPIRALQPMLQIPGMVRLLLHVSAAHRPRTL